jgi:hypothetical protein
MENISKDSGTRQYSKQLRYFRAKRHTRFRHKVFDYCVIVSNITVITLTGIGGVAVKNDAY